MKKPPKVTLSKQQLAILNQFPKEVNKWKKFLKGLGFKVITLDTYDPSIWGYNNDSNIVFEGGFDGAITPNEGVRRGLIITSGSFVTAEQFLANKYWPDVYRDELPNYLEVDFFTKDRAEIVLGCGIGDELFDSEKYLTEKWSSHSLTKDTFRGTWQEVAERLLAIKAEMATNLLRARLQ